jgi:hypothetical protein
MSPETFRQLRDREQGLRAFIERCRERGERAETEEEDLVVVQAMLVIARAAAAEHVRRAAA